MKGCGRQVIGSKNEMAEPKQPSPNTHATCAYLIMGIRTERTMVSMIMYPSVLNPLKISEG